MMTIKNTVDPAREPKNIAYGNPPWKELLQKNVTGNDLYDVYT